MNHVLHLYGCTGIRYHHKNAYPNTSLRIIGAGLEKAERRGLHGRLKRKEVMRDA